MTEEKNPVVILDETEDQSRCLVQLEAIHEIDKEGSLSLLYTASLTQAGATLHRISSDEPPTNFYLNVEALDALIAARLDFKHAQEAQKRAEAERKQAAIAEAHAIATRYPEIKIKPGEGYWRVSMPSQGYNFCSPAYYPDDLLTQVKTCRAVLQGQTSTGGDAA